MRWPMRITHASVAPALCFSAFLLADAGKPLILTIGKGDLLQLTNEVQRVAVAEPKIADAIVVSPHEVMVNAKGLGKTTVVIWETGSEPTRYDVSVVADSTEMDLLRQELHTLVSTISVSGTPESLVLTGSAPDAETSKRAQALVATHAKTVVNLLQTPPPAEPRQIMLEVKFATVDRTRLAELGFNLFSTNGKGIGETSTEQFQQPRFTQLQLPGGSAVAPNVNFADLLNLFYFNPSLNLGGTIRALQARNVLQILAEPTLITLEGKTASFLAGGQFPFPTITSTTTGGAIAPVITVQFKPFGVKLDFTPTITSKGAIDLQVSPEVSSLDFTNAVQLQGFLIPALSSRKADTEVVLNDGESFAIAGLIDNRVTQVFNKVPWIGDVPILGQLFKSRSTQKTSEELLVVVTPHFVRPLAPGEKAKLPSIALPYLPTIEEEKAAKDKKKGSKDPEFVGPRGHQDPPATKQP